jgi:hypothetical protein
MRALFVLLLIGLVAGDLACSYECDDPVCNATCKPKCKDWNCTFTCPLSSECDDKPDCRIKCLDGADPSAECPLCEVFCEKPRRECRGCEPLCEEVECGWGECEKPVCEQPHCELQCPEPACKFIAAAGRFSLF